MKAMPVLLYSCAVLSYSLLPVTAHGQSTETSLQNRSGQKSPASVPLLESSPFKAQQLKVQQRKAQQLENHGQWLKQLLPAAQESPALAISQLIQRLQDYPDWHRGRLELARLYYRSGHYRAARKSVRKVVETAELPPPVQRNVLAFYRQILQAEQASRKTSRNRWQVGGQFSLIPGYDSNANTGPEDQDIGVNNIQLKHSALARSDHYQTSQLQLYSRYQPSSQLRWLAQIQAFRRDYQHYDDADLTSLQLMAGPDYRLNDNWILSTRFQFNRVSYDQTTVNYSSLEPGLRWQQGAHLWQLHARYQDRNYLARRQSNQDGYTQELGLRYHWRQKPWQLQLGLRLLEGNYNDDRYSYQAREVEGQLRYRLTPDFSLRAQARYRYSDYDAAEKPLYNDNRKEGYLTLRLAGRYQITPSLALELVLSDYDNRANHALHDYDRQQAELALRWQF
ncbi:MAG: MipA/OmpV family protein [Marinobacterium sp.]|nr:MipA/OmpV family protein [Marinobacterium sp.]